MVDPTQPPTQVQHPWRATLRTVAAFIVGVLPVLPTIVNELGLSGVGWVMSVLAVAAAATRVLAIPAVQDWLADHAAWLSANGKPQ